MLVCVAAPAPNVQTLLRDKEVTSEKAEVKRLKDKFWFFILYIPFLVGVIPLIFLVLGLTVYTEIFSRIARLKRVKYQ